MVLLWLNGITSSVEEYKFSVHGYALMLNVIQWKTLRMAVAMGSLMQLLKIHHHWATTDDDTMILACETTRLDFMPFDPARVYDSVFVYASYHVQVASLASLLTKLSNFSNTLTHHCATVKQCSILARGFAGDKRCWHATLCAQDYYNEQIWSSWFAVKYLTLWKPRAQLCARGEIRFFTEWKFSIPAHIWDLFTGIYIIRYVLPWF